MLAQPANATRNGVVTGELVIEPPTLINLGLEWLIQGDDNRNAAVQVSYRKPGEAAWSSGLPLLRLQRERVFVGPQFDVVAPNMFAGSILDLEPDTDYEARFVMTDPDGVTGEATRIVTVRTRAEPVPHEDGRVLHRLPAWLRGHQARTILRGKAAGDGDVVFDGNGNFALFNVMAADHTCFEGITFRNTEFAIWAGEQFIAGSKGLTVKHCRFCLTARAASRCCPPVLHGPRMPFVGS